jgi:hypothetical protein
MNMNQNPTINDLAAVLRQCNDKSGHHIMWVDFAGNVRVSQVPEELTPIGFIQSLGNQVKFRYETWVRGNGYVGHAAVTDQRYLEEQLHYLKRDWASNQTGYIDF